MSKRIVGDTKTVATTGPWANRIIAIVLTVAVAIVGFLALRSLFAADQPEASIPVDETDVAGAERPYPGRELVIDDNEFPLTISCVRASASGGVFVVIVTNDGPSATDYLVAAELSNEAEQSVTALAEINDLRAGEERETVLVPDADIGEVDFCEITAVQGDRRVLLSR